MNTLAIHRLRVKLFGILMRFANAIQIIPAKITPPPFRLMQIGSLFWQSRALYVATKLGVADALGDTEKTTQQIADALGLNEDHLYRLMRLLQSMGIFEETAPRVFSNSKTSEFLRMDNPRNVRAMILMHNSAEMTQPWLEPLEASIRDGEVPFEKVHGATLFDYMDQNMQFDLLFSQAMDTVENLTGTAYLDDFNWDTFDRLIDVGGSKGSKTLAILKACPGLNAVVFDRPQIIEEAKSLYSKQLPVGLRSRIDFQGGDLYESLPMARSDNDLYLFFAIFHGLSDDQSTTVLGNLKTAMGNRQPYALIADTVVEDMQCNASVAAFDMQMLIGTKGRERTRQEWENLVENSGFKIVEILDVRTFVKFIVIRPR